VAAVGVALVRRRKERAVLYGPIGGPAPC